MRRIRIAAATVMVAAGLIGAVAAPASAAPETTKPLEALCTAQGGEFSISIAAAICTGTGDFSEAQLTAARAVCERAYRGAAFNPDFRDNDYACLFLGF